MKYTLSEQQPSSVDIKLVDGVFVKATTFQKAGMIAPQHAHRYSHLSYIASGAVRVTAGGVMLGELVAPSSIVIQANVKHLFEILTDGTVVLCIHNADHADDFDEHQLDFEVN